MKCNSSALQKQKFNCCAEQNLSLEELYLNGGEALDQFLSHVQKLKLSQAFIDLFLHRKQIDRLDGLSKQVSTLIREEEKTLSIHMGHLETGLVECISARLEKLKDAQWCLANEIKDNIDKTDALITHPPAAQDPKAIKIFREINTVLNSIDRLEVRGRDSAGISLLFVLAQGSFFGISGPVGKG